MFNIKQYNGPIFNLIKAKALIKLRRDFKEEDLTDGVEQCKEVFDNYQEEKKDEVDNMNYFQLIELEIKRKEAEERKIQREKERERVKELKKNQKILKKNDFLEGEEEEKKEDDDKPQKFAVEEEDKDVIQEEVSDITHEGYMQKKIAFKLTKKIFPN